MRYFSLGIQVNTIVNFLESQLDLKNLLYKFFAYDLKESNIYIRALFNRHKNGEQGFLPKMK